MKERIASLPDALTTLEGREVTTAEQWMQVRRPEIMDLFREHVYGREPLQRPDTLRFETVESGIAMGGASVRKRINIVYEGPGGTGTIRLLLYIPTHTVRPVPAFLLINNREEDVDDPNCGLDSTFWPAKTIVSRGYAAAMFQTKDVDPDEHDGFHNGVHGIFDPPGQPRAANAWATIAAWAWGACRVLDYLETDPDIDASQVALVGHSRGGKTALWAGAVDTRFAMVVSNNSGNTGAAISRGKRGETIRNINTVFPHWFTDNYKTFNDREYDLPVDQHLLLAAIAPRPLYAASASEDDWADPESEFVSLTLTSPVYRLFGLPSLDLQPFPQPDTPIQLGNTGYHVRTGEHDLTEYDWNSYLNFAQSVLGKSEASRDVD